MPPAQPRPWTDEPASVRPMLATPHDDSADDLLRNPRWVFERKLDGMRILALIEPGEVTARVQLWTRNGREKTEQFPDLIKDLRRFARSLRRTVLLDGEVVAIDDRGQPLSFQKLAPRIHLTGQHAIAAEAKRTPVAFVVFDVLRDGADDLRPIPLVQRRARLEKIIGNAGSEVLRFGDQSAGGDGRRLLAQAERDGWEGLIAKDAESSYVSGKRHPAWRKIKLPCRQEFVVGGWTRPRGGRIRFGALLVGYYEGDGDARGLRYAGSVGSGFDAATLEQVWKLLQARATGDCPFATTPAPMEKPSWVRPELVVEVKFTEWTDEQMLRHPTFLGLRDDIDPLQVTREPTRRITPPRIQSPARIDVAPPQRLRPAAPPAKSGTKRTRAAGLPTDPAIEAIVAHLQALEDAKRDGVVVLPDGQRLDVTNLAKVFWPGPRVTKGELMRYYARISPWLLPVLADRPLIMKRFPNGIAAKTFYQQRAPDEVPPGVRVEPVEEDDEVVPRLIGGSLQTLLYTTQLASLSQDPWFSRIDTRHDADFAALDLDPMPGVPFTQVIEVARLVGDELRALNVPAVAKTSGSSGLHIYIPLPSGTPYEAGQLFCQIVASLIATRHPTIATVERTVAKRGRTVYMDYLQNIEGKSLASAYSVRASEFAGVSTPVGWEELLPDLHPEDFTIRTALTRFRSQPDGWAVVHGSARADLRDALEKLARRY